MKRILEPKSSECIDTQTPKTKRLRNDSLAANVKSTTLEVAGSYGSDKTEAVSARMVEAAHLSYLLLSFKLTNGDKRVIEIPKERLRKAIGSKAIGYAAGPDVTCRSTDDNYKSLYVTGGWHSNIFFANKHVAGFWFHVPITLVFDDLPLLR
jgi:hypothetical protein